MRSPVDRRDPAGLPAGRVAASPKEEALWLLENLVPGSVANNISVAFGVAGRLQLPALAEVLTALLRRHEPLRTVYHATGARLARAVIPPAEVRVEVQLLDAPATTPGGAAAGSASPAVTAALSAFVARPFTLDGQPLVRAGLLRQPEGDYLCLAVHHLVFDAVSVGVVVDELVAGYDRLVAGEPLPEPLTRPADPVPEVPPKPESMPFWVDTMAGVTPDGPDLACGRPDVAEPTLVGEQLTRQLPPEVRAAVRSLQRTLRAPEAVVLLTAYLLLLDAHGIGPDIVVGSPVNVRPGGAERAVGYHVNVLPLRVRVDPALTVRELTRRTREVFFAALTHADVPVDSLVRALPRATATWRNMLFRHVFNYVTGLGLPEFEIGGLRATPLVVENGYSKFDLEFFVLSDDREIRLRTVYRTEILSRSDVELLLERYEALLLAFADAADRPVGELAVWSARDKAVIGAANRTAGPVQPESVLAGLHAVVTADPAATAVEDGDRVVSYRGLWDAALRVRDLLAGAGVGAGDVVAVAAARSPELAAAVLGTWLAGGTYMPIDPDHPASRIAYQLADSGARVAIADPAGPPLPGDGLRVLWPDPVPDARTGTPDAHSGTDAPTGTEPTSPTGELPVAVDPAGNAYLIYTSGSTGKPKGTLVTQLGLANVTAHFAAELGVRPGDGMLWLTTFAFDISGLELFVPLVTGGRVVVAPDAARVDGDVLRTLVERHRVRTVQATPTTWRMVLSQAGAALRDRLVLCGGEPVPVKLARELIATGCELHHVYGPTETTIWSTSGVLAGDLGPRLDVGRPLLNTQVLVTDAAGRQLPIGVRGELCIAGAGVAAGYHGRPELTAERFGEHPVYGRFYRTGDVAHWNPDGTLSLLGRSDRQVKLRGNRIELGEIEAALLGHPGVRAVAVVVVGDPSADARLVAFVEAADSALTVESLWERARAELSRSTVPQEFVILDALPTNASEKVDYPALTRLAVEGTVPGGAEQAGPAADPADPLTARLVELWRELLEHDRVTPDTNFFTSGGDSLLGAMLGQRVEELTGVSLRLAELFDSPTPALLADRIRAAELELAEAGEAR